MNKHTKRLLQYLAPLCLLFFIAGPAHAADGSFFGQKADGTWLIGLKAGYAKNDNVDYGNARNRGLVLGYMFARPVEFDGSAAIEIESMSTYEDGKIGEQSAFLTTGSYSIDHLAIYFAYRTPGTVYFKAKAGYATSEMTTRVANSSTATIKEESQFSLGAGLGMRVGQHANVELEYVNNIGNADVSGVNATLFVHF